MPFKPKYEGEIAGYVVNYLKQHHWKVARTVPYGDCLQEAQVVFLRLARKYTGVTEAKHFMALFKTSWHNHFTDLANEDTADRVNVSSDVLPDQPAMEYIGETENAGYLAVMVEQAPREVSMVLSLFLNAPSELLEMALASWRQGDRRERGNGSKRINKLLGLPEDQDTLEQVHKYFSD